MVAIELLQLQTSPPHSKWKFGERVVAAASVSFPLVKESFPHNSPNCKESWRKSIWLSKAGVLEARTMDGIDGCLHLQLGDDCIDDHEL